MPEVKRLTLGDALEHCYESARSEWRHMHPATTPDEMYGQWPAAIILQEAAFFPGGRLNVTVTMNAKRGWQTEVFFFRLARREGLYEFLDRTEG